MDKKSRNNKNQANNVSQPPEQALTKELQAKQVAIVEKEQQLKTQEADLDRRQRQLNAQMSDVAEKMRQLSAEKAKLGELQLRLDVQQAEAENGFPALLAERFEPYIKGLEQRESVLRKQTEKLQQQEAKLVQREDVVARLRAQADAGFLAEHQSHQTQLTEMSRQAEQELLALRQRRYAQLEDDINSERQKRYAQITEQLESQRQEFEQHKQKQWQDIKQEAEQLNQLKAQLDEQTQDIEYQKAKLQVRSERLNQQENELPAEVERLLMQRQQSFDVAESQLKQECERLQGSLKASTHALGLFTELKYKLDGRDPEEVLIELKTLEQHNIELRAQLLNGPNERMQQMYDDMASEIAQLRDELEQSRIQANDYKRTMQDSEFLELEIESLRAKNISLNNRLESYGLECERLTTELKRLQSSYQCQQERDVRIQDIQLPCLVEQLQRSQGTLAELPTLDTNESTPFNELQWLEHIYQSCQNYGLTFHRRILYAFHTALKTAEWSPLTVLSGVSGTGKSELPRLYSHFGGINFLSLAVQPNWDSQESMLGFFNAIDNKFDAQPVLRLLAQTQQEQSEDYPGLKDTVSLVLLDEMNLAHVELYFAEFLSKLELRRGKREKNVPCLDVKLGAGIEPYQLPLGRNVLWTGTMNQDETTKSLSDKVLDRSIAIHFPRPTRLHRREKLQPLDNPAPLLAKKTWFDWWCKESGFTESQIRPYREFVEQINRHLEVAGKALGHRVWQSIEYYMANYPTVMEAQRNNDEAQLKKAMKIAFEDQLVQKVMPKLRGIETRGRSQTECLEKIKEQLVKGEYNIVDDFELACSIGYGQFIFSSANYLKDDDNDDEDETQPEQTNISEIKTQPKMETEGKLQDSGISDGHLSQLKEYCMQHQKSLNTLGYRLIKGLLKVSGEKAKEIEKLLKVTVSEQPNE